MGNIIQSRMQAATEQAATNYAQTQMERVYRWPFCQHVDRVASITGIVAVILVWISAFSSFGVTTMGLAVYLLLLAIPITLLELNWLINKLPLCNGEGFCCTMWKFTQLLDGWKRAVFYGVAAIPCFLIPIISVTGVVCGLLFFFMAVVNVLKAFQYSKKQDGFADISGTNNAAPQAGYVPPGTGPTGMQDPAGYMPQGGPQGQYGRYP